jgi:hypothetical protein
VPDVAPAPVLDRGELAQAAILVALTPVLVLVAAHHDYTSTLGPGTQLTIAMLLFQAALLVVGALRRRDTSEAPPRIFVFATAGLAGAALLVTATLPVGAWFSGLAMFACFVLDATMRRRTRFAWAPLTFGLAFMACWAFAAIERWDTLVWWLFVFAPFAALALNSPGWDQGARAIVSRRTIGGALAGVGLLCSTAALVLAWRSPGAAILIAIEGAFALLMIQRAARRFGARGIFGVASAACALATAVFVFAI